MFSHPLNVLALLCLYILVIVITGRLEQGFWTGHIALATYVGWLTDGPLVSLWIVFIGTIIGFIIHWVYVARQRPSWELLSEIVGRIAITGNGVLMSHTLYRSLGGNIPFAHATFDQMLPLGITLVCSYLVMQVIGVGLTNISLKKRLLDNREIFLEEPLLVMATFVLPLININIGAVAFTIIIGVIGVQAVRYYQVQIVQQSLTRRLEEMSLLNNLSETISHRLELDEVLHRIYQEIQQLVESTTFFVALYNGDHQTIDYPLAYENGQLQQWLTHKLGDGLPDYIIRSRRLLLLSTIDTTELEKLGIKIRGLTAQQYLGIPLLVGEKVIGALVIGCKDDVPSFTDSDFKLLQTIASHASLALRNAALYKRTVSLADNLALINASLHNVMFNLDRDDAMRAACELAIQVAHAQKAAIFLLQPNLDNRVELVMALGFPEPTPFDSLPHQMLPLNNGPRFITNVAHTDDVHLQAHAAIGQFTAIAQIPLRSGNIVTGCLNVYHDEEHFYDAPELNLLGMVANQITASLDNGDLLQALELYAAEQAQLVHLSRISTSNLDLERIISDVGAMLSHILETPHIELGLHDTEEDTLHLYGPTTDDEPISQRTIAFDDIPEFYALTQAEAPNIVQTYYTEYESYSPALQTYMATYHLQTLALISMRINQQSIGMIIVADTVHRLFNDNDYRLLEMAAHQIAAQLHNARIHALTEEALVKRLEELTLLEESAQQISKTLDSDLLIDNILDVAMQATQAECAILALIQSTSHNRFNLILKEQLDEQIVQRTTNLTITDGVIGWVAQAGEVLVISDNQTSETYRPIPDSLQQYISSLAVPLLKGERMIGVLDIESTQPNFFTTEHINFIKSLAGHAAVSLDNAHLLEERKQQINTLTRLRSLSLETLSLLEQRQVARAILQTAMGILEGNSSALYTYGVSNSLTMLEGATLTASSQITSDTPNIPNELIQNAAQTGTLQFVSDTQQSPIYPKYRPAIHYRSVLAIPIHRRQTIEEVLCITFERPRQISLQHLHTIDLLAVQVASHLENAALNEVIRNSNGRMRAILDANRDAIIFIHPDGRLQDANRTAEILLNLPLRQHLDTKFAEVVQTLPYVNPLLHDISNTYDSDLLTLHDREYTLSETEQPTTIKTLATQVNDERHNVLGYLLVLREITEEKQLEKFRETIQSMVLHDLRGQLGGIISNLHLATSFVEFPVKDATEKHLLPTLRVSLESANNLMKLVDTLYNLPMIAKMEPHTEPVRLHQLAQSAYNTMAGYMQQAHITVDNAITGDIEVLVDSELIRRVLINLLHNAFKFTPEDGRILIVAKPVAGQLDLMQVQICDTGPGIPVAERERIFEQFVQIENHRPRANNRGMGLGLNFCKLAVEAHGGQIWVEADGPLSGACIAFTIPLLPAPEKAN